MTPTQQQKSVTWLTYLILAGTILLSGLISSRFFDPAIATQGASLPSPIHLNGPTTTSLTNLPPPPYTLHIQTEFLSDSLEDPYTFLWTISDTQTHNLSIYPIGLFSFTDQYPPQRWAHLLPNERRSELWVSVTNEEMIIWLNKEFLLSYPTSPPINLSVSLPISTSIRIASLTIIKE